MSKREHALALRDLALTVARARGSWQTVGNKVRFLTCRLDDVRIALQTPLQQQPSDIPPPAKYLAGHRGKPTPVYLPYVIAVWDGGKVLTVQWADDGAVEIISYKPGAWERDLKRHAAAASQAASVRNGLPNVKPRRARQIVRRNLMSALGTRAEVGG
jgi:hypothetical protein